MFFIGLAVLSDKLDLRIKTRQEVSKDCKMFATPISGQFFYDCFKKMSRNEIEKLLKEGAIIMRDRDFIRSISIVYKRLI